MANSTNCDLDYELLTRVFFNDFDVLDRREVSSRELDGLAESILGISDDCELVYTAFDGDHQMFCSLMRQRVLRDLKVPVNPDSVLGYKDTVQARKVKRGVLLDDLSILRGCDELWVFSDVEPTPEHATELAEGVLVELLFFLKRHRAKPVKFLSMKALLEGHFEEPPKVWCNTYEDLCAALGADQKSELLDLANSGTKTDYQLRNMQYFSIDPLDYKYARIVRAESYGENSAPVLPYLAISPEDLVNAGRCPSEVVISWAAIQALAGTYTKIPVMEPNRTPSQIVGLLDRVWLRSKGPVLVDSCAWTEYSVPKAELAHQWALTPKESSKFLEKDVGSSKKAAKAKVTRI